VLLKEEPKQGTAPGFAPEIDGVTDPENIFFP